MRLVLPLVVLAACSASPSAEVTDASPGSSSDAGVTLDAPSNDDAAPTDGAPATADALGETPLSFVVVGCNRVQKGDVTQSVPSTANLAQLQRTFDEVAKLQPAPKLFFFDGDMVLGLTNETDLAAQLAAWVAVYKASSLASSGITLVPIPGNHEMESKTKSGDEIAYAAAESTWLAIMAPYVRGSNGPTAGGPDGLQTDQSRLSYSFDEGATHFVVLNTDPVGADSTVPAKWVAADLAAARGAGAKHVFAIGHKPAYPSPYSTENGLLPASRDALWTALEQAHAEAMLAAHNHLWFKTRPAKTWQIVAGNGGSQLESGVTGPDAYYGFTLVSIAADGTVTATSHGRDVPAAGYTAPAPEATYPTTVRDTVDLTWR